MSVSAVRRSGQNKLTTALVYIVLGFLTVFFIFPFYWIVTGSLKLQYVAVQVPPEFFPLQPTFENWTLLFKQPAARWLANSFVISICTMLLVCVSSSLAGYVLAKKHFIGCKQIFWMFIAAMCLPKQVILIPLVQLVASWGFSDTLIACILPAVGWPFGIFLMKQFTQTLPTELLEAARMDGYGEFKTFTRIVAPLVKPGIAALAIFTFIQSWNDYFSQLIFLNSRNNMTLPLGLATLQLNEFSSNYGLLMAGATLASVPMIAIFLLFQKSFTQGITMGAVKG
ncbi:carbohydrate ABC transporter permease [Treponema brennaborense]|uniref:ABC-type transporter, integral membrane subunit n=1 Tax=Treponema brennaborense (strain DSM 12168 / CIP 105900 / DD5/3) TaxID=906968 RepID=F4LNA4_TREBD|nr:carbohydrate ABC transporter permease [Treponema brennaborense]AEE16869.1 ABC-type transporter, integral membrane subunit [Treponema brennaborense DSM 12168]